MIGNFYREGRLYTTDVVRVNDHDFPSLSEGIIIPHGIYDLQKNIGYMMLGNSHDTAEFACECIRNWWENHGRQAYPGATQILILCDGGGSNNSRHHIFKSELAELSNDLMIEIRIAHYPPYTSKYNPIEHKLFCHVTRALQGVVFKSMDLVDSLIKKTSTKTGLKVFSSILDKMFELGREAPENFEDSGAIVRDEKLSKWNYVAIPDYAIK